MRRREFISLLGGAAASATWPRAASAQEAGRTYRLGFLIPVERQAPAVVAFFDELRLNGFIEGHNLTLVPGGFEVRNEQITELVAAMVKAAPDAIVSGGDLTTRALQQATRTLPLIGMTDNMVAAGLVASLSRPGGNTTGISLLSPELEGKRQDILIEAVPGARRMAVLADSTITAPWHLQALQGAVRARGVELSVVAVAKPEEIVPAINDARASGAKAFNVLSSPMLFLNRRVIFERVAALHLPAIYQWPEMAEEGGFAAYGPRFNPIFRQWSRMVVKVLRGAKPADLPIEQPTNFELVINLKTAKAIGHEVPAGLVLRADKLIE